MSTQSPLINLPAELRNCIFEFVLSSSTPLVLHLPQSLRDYKTYKKYYPDVETLNSGMSHVEFNQLKYVNMQLHSETAGLEFKYNDIKIEWEVLRTGNSHGRLGVRTTDWRWILFKKGELVNVGSGASSQGCRLKDIWEYAQIVWEVRCGTH